MVDNKTLFQINPVGKSLWDLEQGIKKEIKELEDRYNLNTNYDFKTGLRTPVEIWIFKKAKLQIIQEIKGMIEDVDIELMLTDIKDKEGNKAELSDEIMEIISIWWKGKKQELLGGKE